MVAHLLHRRTLLVGLLTSAGTAALGAAGPRMSTRDVVSLLFATQAPERPNLSGFDLSELDLSQLDFKSAILRGADLFAADLTSSSLDGTDLSNTRLDRSVIIKTSFAGANMQGCSFLRPSAFTGLHLSHLEVPVFREANLTNAKILAKLDGADFTGANLTDASLNWAPYMQRRNHWGTGLNRSRFDNAVAIRAGFADLSMKQASFRGANVQHADFANADLSGADFSEADISHADFTGATLSDATLDGARGKDLAVGL